MKAWTWLKTIKNESKGGGSLISLPFFWHVCLKLLGSRHSKLWYGLDIARFAL